MSQTEFDTFQAIRNQPAALTSGWVQMLTAIGVATGVIVAMVQVPDLTVQLSIGIAFYFFATIMGIIPAFAVRHTLASAVMFPLGVGLTGIVSLLSKYYVALRQQVPVYVSVIALAAIILLSIYVLLDFLHYPRRIGIDINLYDISDQVVDTAIMGISLTYIGWFVVWSPYTDLGVNVVFTLMYWYLFVQIPIAALGHLFADSRVSLTTVIMTFFIFGTVFADTISIRLVANHLDKLPLVLPLAVVPVLFLIMYGTSPLVHNSFISFVDPHVHSRMQSIYIAVFIIVTPLALLLVVDNTTNIMQLVGGVALTLLLYGRMLMVLFNRQLEDQKQHSIQEQLTFQHTHDALTRVLNRVALDDVLPKLLAPGTNAEIAIIYTDIDNFKQVNNQMGAQAGDEVLNRIVRRLKDVTAENDYVIRMGGDEFVVIITECPSIQWATDQAMLIVNSVNGTYKLLDGGAVTLTMSAGVITGKSGEDAGDIMRLASAALYKAKAVSPHTVATIDQGEMNNTLKAFKDEQYLRLALENQEFELYYQPLVSVADESCIGFEALARWPSSEGIGPDVFIPMLESAGLSEFFGRWVLGKATRFAADINTSVAINISPRHMHNVNFTKDVISALHGSGLPAEHLTVEITERSSLPSANQVANILHELHNHGIKVAVDDFGTGMFSLFELGLFPIDIIKIDRMFVKNASTSKEDLAVIESIVTITRQLNMATVAEGVEDNETLEVIRAQGCVEAQGYKWSRPLPADEARTYWYTHNNQGITPQPRPYDVLQPLGGTPDLLTTSDLLSTHSLPGIFPTSPVPPSSQGGS